MFYNLFHFSNIMKELHHTELSNIKTESEMAMLSVKYDLEEQFKNQKVGIHSSISPKHICYMRSFIFI